MGAIKVKRQIQGAAFAAAPFLIGSAAHAQWSNPYTAPRNAVVGATGTVHITDGSGNLLIENVGGDVTVNDGSGDIDVRNVAGSFTVESDGSGSIYATDIRGSVIVQNDGSGKIDVNKVGRDFKVESKGSGSIEYTAVTGQVDIPDRRPGRYHRSEDR
jgi:DUF4097 and DUF4098 domain-containing protein YvlB